MVDEMERYPREFVDGCEYEVPLLVLSSGRLKQTNGPLMERLLRVKLGPWGLRAGAL